MRKKISQAAARAALKRVDELERAERERRNTYAYDYPGGVNVGTYTVDDHLRGRLEGAQMVGCALVIRVQNGRVYFYALPQMARNGS